ncbi:MAG TPA: DsbA family protein [Gammaproteobacteria bacterium]
MNKRSLKVFIIVFCFLSACDSREASTQNQNSGDWVNEEILKQLSALREDNIAIRNELKSINEKLSQLEKKPVAGGGRPSAPETIDFDSKRALGDKKAKVAIIEYTDYQCPFCARHAKNVFPQIKENLIETGKARYQVADYPLSFHAAAKLAAVAVSCAGKHGVEEYWAMHDALFANTGDLGEALYLREAEALGIDSKVFSTCLNDPENGKAVDRSVAYGNKIGVSGTPKFFIGRIEGDTITDISTISGAQSYGVFEATVSKLLNEG